MANVEYQEDNGNLKLTIVGQLDTDTASKYWARTAKKVKALKPPCIEVDAAGVEHCDGAGAAFILQLKQKQQTLGREFNVQGLKDEYKQLAKIFEPGEPVPPEKKPSMIFKTIDSSGRLCCRAIDQFVMQITFIGELFIKFVSTLFHIKEIRLGHTFLIAEKSGADAVGIVSLVGLLIGLILTFQSAVAMSKIGAEMYVPDIIVISLFRELGPLITAIVFASRSGSAYAAELGTMKVNEEVDALAAMGIDPLKYLVMPRMVAGILTLPLLTLFYLSFALLGSCLVMLSFDVIPITFIDQIQEAVSFGDLVGGLVKTFFFGALIAGTGCLKGLNTGSGPSAVGDSATRAVVSSIIGIVVIDGVFAVIYYYLKI